MLRLSGGALEKDLASAISKASWAAGIDLNRASEGVALRAKADMDDAFRRTFVGRDDPHFVYDKQVDFGDAEEDSGWD